MFTPDQLPLLREVQQPEPIAAPDIFRLDFSYLNSMRTDGQGKTQPGLEEIHQSATDNSTKGKARPIIQFNQQISNF
jgi:hypothetical protein